MNSTIKMNNTAKAQSVSRMPAVLAITICNLLSIFDACAAFLRCSAVRFLLRGTAFTVAIFYVFGCVGGIETSSIGFSEAVLRSAIALGAAFLISYVLRDRNDEEA